MKYLRALTLEKCLRIGLIPFFLYVATKTMGGSYYSYLVNHNFNIGDWLINYQGGFVRRGLTGEIAFQFYRLTQIPPGVWVMGMHALFFFTYFYCAWLLLLFQAHLAPFAFLIVSPIIFYFQINDWQGGFRKEIIGIAILSILCLLSLIKPKETFNTAFKITCILFSLAILSHELLAVFVPYLFAVYFLKNQTPLKQVIPLPLYLIPSVAAFLFSTRYMGNEQLMNDIYASLGPYAPHKGAIYGLIADTHESFTRTWHKIINRDQKNHYFIALLFISIAFIPIRSRIKHIFTQPLVLLMVIGSYIMTFPLFLVGTDWGRFIYLHVCSLFLLCLACREIPTNGLPLFIEKWRANLTARYLLNGVFFVTLLLYATQWEMRHCCL